MRVKKVESIHCDTTELYDLTVKDTHTYCVGKSSVVVHNCGVGFSPQAGVLNGFMRPIEDIQVIRSTRTIKGGAERNTETWLSSEKTWILQIGDSAKAWAKAVGKLISGKYPAKKLVIDLSQIRPAGERLRGYGWISSGDEQLHKALIGICSVMNKAAGRLLTELDILDVVNWMGTVLSSRRSAELALLSTSNSKWRDFAIAKKDHFDLNPQRAQSNNSLIFYEKPSKGQLFEVFDLMMAGGGTEPGIVNGATAIQRAPYFSGLNPSLRAGTLVMTDHGVVPIESLDSKQFQVRNLYGEWQPAMCWLSGKNKPLWEITLIGGHKIYATEEHKWPVVFGDTVRKLSTSKLVSGMQLPTFGVDVLIDSDIGSYEDGFFCGWVFGDGWITYRRTGEVQVGLCVAMVDCDVLPLLIDKLKELGSEAAFKKNKNANCYELMTSHSGVVSLLSQYGCLESKDFGIPKSLFETTSEAFRRGFVDAIFSSDGCVGSRGKDKGLGFGLSSSRRMVIQSLSDLLGFYGIHSTIKGGVLKKSPTFPNGKVYDREYEYHTLSINSHEGMSRFLSLFKLTAGRKQRLLEQAVGQSTKPNMRKSANLSTIKSVVKTDLLEDVWDITVNDDTHCFQLAHCVTGNCGEILLGDKGFCNLAEVVLPRFNGDLDGLKRAMRLIARANYRQSCVNLDDGVLQRTWHELNEYLHLCGVGLTGIVQWEYFDGVHTYDSVSKVLETLKTCVWSGAVNMADELDMPRPASVTTTKPSGTLSKLADCSEGIHNPIGKYVFNKINFSAHDPLVAKLTKAGYDVMENPYDPTGVLVTFPVMYEGSKFTNISGKLVDDESAVDQLNRYKFLMKHYVTHNVSSTVSYRRGEIGQIVEWLYDNWDHYVSATFMPRKDATKLAEELGYPYLPQEVKTERDYVKYVTSLGPIDFNSTSGDFVIEAEDCPGGVCPVR